MAPCVVEEDALVELNAAPWVRCEHHFDSNVSGIGGAAETAGDEVNRVEERRVWCAWVGGRELERCAEFEDVGGEVELVDVAEEGVQPTDREA